VYRMARGPEPWAWVDWVYAGPDGTFGGRFDDTEGEYRVLYAAATRLGAFMETLAGFRTHPAVRQSLPDGDAAAPDSVPR
jgi:RES domain-containing protein